MNEKLIEYIKRNLESGYSNEAILNAMLKVGYDTNTAKEHIIYALKSQYASKYKNSTIIEKDKKNSSKKTLIVIILLLIAIAIPLAYYYFPSTKEDTKTSNEINADKNDEGLNFNEDRDDESLSLLNKALIENDESICEQIGDNGLKEQCKNSFSFGNVNETCDAKCEDNKFLNLAIIESDSSLCLQINDSSIKDQCMLIFKKEAD